MITLLLSWKLNCQLWVKHSGSSILNFWQTNILYVVFTKSLRCHWKNTQHLTLPQSGRCLNVTWLHFPWFIHWRRTSYNKEASRLYAELLPSHADEMHASRQCVDDMWMMCRQCAGDVQMTCKWHMSFASEISPEISLSCHLHIVRILSTHHLHIICTSSTCHPHVICMRFQPQKYFQLNSRATALLKKVTL